MKVTDLIKFCEKTLAEFDEYIKESEIQPSIKLVTINRYKKLEISEQSSKSEWLPEIIQKPDWTLTIYKFMEEKVKKSSEFTKLVKLIVKNYKKNIPEMIIGIKDVKKESQVSFWLGQFLQRLILKKMEGKIKPETIIEETTIFKSEFDLAPHKYNFNFHLNGLFIEEESIRINENINLRKLSPLDLEFEKDLFFESPMTRHIGLPASVLEIELFTKEVTECHSFNSRILSSLRLFKLGSIYPMDTIINKESVIWGGGESRSSGFQNYSNIKKYTVLKTETDLFINFVNSIEKGLDYDKQDKRFRILNISIDRYNSALLEMIDNERKLMTAVMGLESLFTFEKDRGENSYKLGLRVSKILSLLDYDPIEVRKNVEEAYSYRNKVVHGAYISPDNNQKINKLFQVILNYLRVSLIIFILKNKSIGKDKFVEIIDKSTISEDFNDELKKIIDEEIDKYKPILT